MLKFTPGVLAVEVLVVLLHAGVDFEEQALHVNGSEVDEDVDDDNDDDSLLVDCCWLMLVSIDLSFKSKI
jgi:hypothetical protein